MSAHNNELALGRGASHKTPDWLIAYLCGDPGGCHDKVDGRSGGLSIQEKRAMWNVAYVKTVNLWFIEHMVSVA